MSGDLFAGKPVEEIDAEALQALIGTHQETLYVECKSVPPKRGIARVAASFLNSDGGWILLGVETNQATGTISGVPGLTDAISREDITNLLRTVDPPLDQLVTTKSVPLQGDQAGRFAVVVAPPLVAAVMAPTPPSQSSLAAGVTRPP